MVRWLLVVFSAALAAQASPVEEPRTRPERTDWRETSTNADVEAFLAELARQPPGERTLRRETIGHTVQGRPLSCVYVRLGDAARLRALVIANIHGGEVEGKEVVQILLRELLRGAHDDLLREVELAFVPVFNADGNDEIDRGNRVAQNGPDGGVGRRHNSQDRDLNRDFVKAETPEVRALLAVFTAWAPHLFLDLHTTNGSYHGYHLTYCTSLNGNTDPDLAALMHERFLPAVRRRLHEDQGWRTFDYGNFGRGGAQTGWTTFSADPRLAINYAGLRHCLSLLSEAYSYLSFADRAKVTRAFVLESLRELVGRRDEVLHLRAQAEARAAELPFRFGHELAPPVPGEVLVGAVEEVAVGELGTRRIAKPEFQAVPAPLRVRFVAGSAQPLPAAWAVVGNFPLVGQTLRAHGIATFLLTAPLRVRGQAFTVRELSRQRAPFQGHRLVTLGGTLADVEQELPAGTLVVPAQQTLARLAAQLLEGGSDDGLATWGFFGDALARAEDAGAARLGYPVLRLSAAPASEQLRPLAADDHVFPALVPYLPAPLGTDGAAPPHDVAVTIEVAAAGTRIGERGFEAEARFSGRALRYRLGTRAAATLDELAAALTQMPAASPAAAPAIALVRRGPGVLHRELVEACAALQRAGVAKVLLWPSWRD